MAVDSLLCRDFGLRYLKAYIFKILLTGVQPAYQVAHPGEKDHTNVDRAAWISTFEEALAKAIVQIVLSRQAEQASQAVGSPKE